MIRISRALLLALVAAVLARPLTAQEVLNRFSYDSLGFRGILVEAGLNANNALKTAGQFGLRVNLGQIAPRVRLQVGGSYFRADLTDEEIQRQEDALLALIDNPGGATVDLGLVRWSDLAFDADFQYLIGTSGRWQPYLGVGVGLHFRNGSGDRIRGTFVEDNLDRTQVGLNATIGADFSLTRWLVLALGGRGVLTGSLNTVALTVGLGYQVPWSSP